MMNLMMEFVPADSVAINRFEVATGHYTVDIAPDGLWSSGVVDEIGLYVHQSPFPAYHLATGDDRWKMTTNFMPLEDFRATQFYQAMQC